MALRIDLKKLMHYFSSKRFDRVVVFLIAVSFSLISVSNQFVLLDQKCYASNQVQFINQGNISQNGGAGGAGYGGGKGGNAGGIFFNPIASVNCVDYSWSLLVIVGVLFLYLILANKS